MNLEIIRYSANSIQFQALRIRGGSEPILFLHGFPDTPYSFEPLMHYFAEKGYDCIAPFMRGYYPTEIPSKLLQNSGASTQVIELAEDVISTIDHFGYDSIHLVGHDWGSIAAYSASNLEPQKIRRLVLLSVPPLISFIKNTFVHPMQFIRSWYILFFQIGFSFPEQVFSQHGFRALDSLWKTWSPNIRSTEYSEKAKKSLSRLRNLSAALSYYRGLFQPAASELNLWKKSAELLFKPIEVPTYLIHGKQDGCIGNEIFNHSELCINSVFKKKTLEDAGHFIQIEKQKELSELIYSFLN